MDSFFNNRLAYTIAHRISLEIQKGVDFVSIRNLDMRELDDSYIDDVWRYCRQHEEEIFIEIHVNTEEDYIAYQTNDDIIFHKTEMFKTNMGKL